MKKIVGVLFVTMLMLSGCVHELKIELAEDVCVEYGESLDNSKLFDAKKSDENVKVKEVKNFDGKKLGEQEVTIVFTDGNRMIEKNLIVNVEDTQKPVIKIKKEILSIMEGDQVTLKDNIVSVEDPVDGKLVYSDKTIEKDGYYIDDGNLDTKKAGTYKINVIAYDVNGNREEKDFEVEVKKKVETAPSGERTSDTSSANSTSQQVTESMTTQEASSPTGNAVANAAKSYVGNSSIWFGEWSCINTARSALEAAGIDSFELDTVYENKGEGGSSVSSPQVGDIVMYYSDAGVYHCAIYIGNGQAVHGGFLPHQAENGWTEVSVAIAAYNAGAVSEVKFFRFW